VNKAGMQTALVLQGYFRIEQFCGARRGAGASPVYATRSPPSRIDAVQTKLRDGSVQAKPVPRRADGLRPELMPPKLQQLLAQTAARSGAAPRSAGSHLLPGMGPFRSDGAHRVGQPRASNGVTTTPVPAGQLRVIGEGRPLEPGIRRTMESFFQADFSGVRVHQGTTAPAMGALAFTLGEEIHFAPGLYDPASPEGVALLGHELTHVVQQRDGRVANPYGRGVAIVQDPALEAEADRMGQQIAAAMWPR
jgi:hypothetical protein